MKLSNIKQSAKEKKIIIRADGGTNIGYGHLMRCRSIALALRNYNWEAIFISSIESILKPWPLVNISGEPLNIIEPQQIINTLSSTTKLEDINVDIIVHVAKEFCSNTILIDHYNYTTDDFLALKNLGYNLIVIDDEAKKHIIADIIVNPNPLVDCQSYFFHEAKLKLCGTKYTIIRPEIKKLVRNNKPVEHGSMLVCFGGTDTSQIYIKLLNKLSNATEKPIIVNLFPDCSRDLLEIWAKSNLSKRALNTNVDAYPDLLQQAEITISSGGNSLWEIYYLGIPNILIPIADNQVNAVKVANNLKTSIFIPLEEIYSNMVDEKRLSKYIEHLSDTNIASEMIKRQQNLIDGNGAERIAEEINNMF